MRVPIRTTETERSVLSRGCARCLRIGCALRRVPIVSALSRLVGAERLLRRDLIFLSTIPSLSFLLWNQSGTRYLPRRLQWYNHAGRGPGVRGNYTKRNNTVQRGHRAAGTRATPEQAGTPQLGLARLECFGIKMDASQVKIQAWSATILENPEVDGSLRNLEPGQRRQVYCY